jgi:hypothetical protein
MTEVMMSRGAGTLHLSSAALALIIAAVWPASAQSDPSARTAKPKQPVTSSRATAKSTKHSREMVRAAPGQPWTIEDALPDHSRIKRQYDYVPPEPKLGRVPLQSGTVGVETETKTNAYKTPDGRTIPGFEATENRPSSYVGFSLSMPTNNDALSIPVPAGPLWGRP